MTPDIAVTSLSLAATYAYWKWSVALTWHRALVAGALLGLAILAKTNAVILVLVVPAASLLAVSRTHSVISAAPRGVAQLVLSFLVTLYVINLGYGFAGSFRRLDGYDFCSRTFRGPHDPVLGNRFRGSILGAILVPVPKSLLEGIDLQRKDFENENRGARTYLKGVWYSHGWWWYYIYVVVLKVPLGGWVLLLISAAVQSSAGRLRTWLRPDILFLVVPGIALFAIASSQTGFGHSLRYVLPAFPFAFVFASGAFRDGLRNPIISIAAYLGLVWYIAGSLATYPHSLSYFNELAGGPMNGHTLLLDGNLDWGQDYLYLENWISTHPDARPLHVGFWGSLPLSEMQMKLSDLEFHGSDVDNLTATHIVPPGWYAISVNHLHGDLRMGAPKYEVFLHRAPVAVVGYSVYIYHVAPSRNTR